jgi:hypothetical protein
MGHRVEIVFLRTGETAPKSPVIRKQPPFTVEGLTREGESLTDQASRTLKRSGYLECRWEFVESFPDGREEWLLWHRNGHGWQPDPERMLLGGLV